VKQEMSMWFVGHGILDEEERRTVERKDELREKM
jgi:hypothetical protein